MRIRIGGRVIYISNKTKAIVIIALIIFGIVAGYFIKKPSSINIDSNASPINTQHPQSTPETEYISVHIIGAVNAPGLVSVPKNCLLADVITAAGGFTKDADLEAPNLAYIISQNVKIRIPEKNSSDKQWLITETTSSDLININTASIEQLTTLPGIGTSTAEKIIKYRSDNGNFKTIEDIKNVSGIKDGVFEKIKEKIFV